MKKITILVALVGLGMLFSANAQLRLDNAKTYSNPKKGYYDKAKIEIDAACEEEPTNAECWAYKGLIYCYLGESTKPKIQKVTPANWADIAYEAALKSKELNTEKDKKIIDLNIIVFKNVAGKFIDEAFNDYEKAGANNDTNLYKSCIVNVDKGIKIYQSAGAASDPDIKKSMNYARYIGGAAARLIGDNETAIKFFKPLVRAGYEKEYVYTSLVTIYQRKGDTIEAMKVAKTYTDKRSNDYNAYLLAAKVAAWANNPEQAKSYAKIATEKASEMTDNNQKVALICSVADVYTDLLDYESAEKQFNEALQLTPNNPIIFNGLGRMKFNNATDIQMKANEVPFDDQTGLYDKLTAQQNEKYNESIEYYKKALESNDRSTPELQQRYAEAFRSLKMVYARANKNLDELKKYE